jgi:hypothetical protein
MTANIVKLREPQSPPEAWHGMTARPHRRYRPRDWETWGELGESARLVDVERRSPA